MVDDTSRPVRLSRLGGHQADAHKQLFPTLRGRCLDWQLVEATLNPGLRFGDIFTSPTGNAVLKDHVFAVDGALAKHKTLANSEFFLLPT